MSADDRNTADHAAPDDDELEVLALQHVTRTMRSEAAKLADGSRVAGLLERAADACTRLLPV